MAEKDPFAQYAVDDPFAAYAVKQEPLRGPSPRSQALLSIPLMPGPLPFLAGNVTAGQVGGLAPDVLGAVGGATFGVPGAAAGGALGRGLEDVIGLDFPSSLGEAGRRYGSEAALQGSMQAIPSLLTRAGKGLRGFREAMREKGVRQTTEMWEKPTLAGRKARAGELAKKDAETTAARKAADAATQAKIASTPGEITIDDLVDDIVADREGRLSHLGVKMSKKMRRELVSEVRSRHRRVVPQHSGKLISGGKLVFDLPTAQVAKQAFDQVVKSAHTGLQGGVKPKPAIDLDIANAWRRLIDERAGVRDLNKATQAAIREEQSVKRAIKAQPTASKLAADDSRTKAMIREKVLLARTANPLKLVSAIPVRGGFAPPGLALKTQSGVFSELAGKLGTGLSHPRGEEIAFAFPRFLALMKYLNEQQPPAPPVDPFGMYVAPPDSLTPP